MENYYEEFKETLLYKHLESSATAEQVKLVQDCINYCHPLLLFYIKAFPNYTLHNNNHQKNILTLTEKMLGSERINKLSSLETALIILSAFFHDIGMVFTDDELNHLSEEETFIEFLSEKFEARLIFEESNNELNKSLAEWYCRWTHAKRVWRYLEKFEANFAKLEWEGISIKEKLGFICESHNNKALSLVDDEKYEVDFLGAADLRFCAVLLRLADILDFDNTRTPKSVYEFLGLEDSRTESDKLSNTEWEKHLVSRGFKFDNTENGFSLKFSAGPKHPQVEKSIELFLDVIEDELKNCSSVIRTCSERWRNLSINTQIDRKDIRSQGYKKGDYKLSLDEHQIITLLTGENLYNSPFEFVRELLQNAIDTSRMRVFHEKSQGNSSFEIEPIKVTSWIDNQGYRWFRIDDYGMGMNEDVISNHLLNKGNSYYKSLFFK